MVRAAGRHRVDAWGMPAPRVYRNPRNLPPRPLHLITRAEWEALPPLPDNLGPRLELPVKHIRYTFTRTDPCEGPDECIPLIQELQKEAQSKGQPDVMFNFLVGGDGLIYEGRGWDYNCTGPDYFVDSPGPSINIAYIGTYEDTLVPSQMGHSGEHIRKWALHHKLLSGIHEITPSLACFKEGEENIDQLAEAVARLGLNKQGPTASVSPPGKKLPSDDKEESEKGSGDDSDDESDEGSDDDSSDDDSSDDDSSDEDTSGESDDGSDDDSDDGSDDDSDYGSDDDSDVSSDDASDDGSDDGSDVSSDDDSDDDSDDGSDEGSEVSSDDGSDDDSDDGSDDDFSDDGSDDDESDDGSDSDSDDGSGDDSDDGSDDSDDFGSDDSDSDFDDSDEDDDDDDVDDDADDDEGGDDSD